MSRIEVYIWFRHHCHDIANDLLDIVEAKDGISYKSLPIPYESWSWRYHQILSKKLADGEINKEEMAVDMVLIFLLEGE